jgi:adenosylmethionine-8-amino-7-oxononanoate aminotransferase
MVLTPPFSITRKEIDEMVNLARLALDATSADVKAEM